MAVAAAGLPYLARGVQRLVEIFIALVALASAVGGHGLPLNVLGSLAIGWGATAVVRLVFGSPLGLPSAGDVRLLLEGLGIRVDRCAARRPGRSGGWRSSRRPRYAGRIRPAASASRSTAGTRPMPGCSPRRAGPVVPGLWAEPDDHRLQQVEHEAYVTMRAGLADVAVPEIVEAATADRPRTRCWSTGCRPGPRCRTRTPRDQRRHADDLYRQLLTLRRARIAHGAISGDAVLVDPVAGTVVLGTSGTPRGGHRRMSSIATWPAPSRPPQW